MQENFKKKYLLFVKRRGHKKPSTVGYQYIYIYEKSYCCDALPIALVREFVNVQINLNNLDHGQKITNVADTMQYDLSCKI